MNYPDKKNNEEKQKKISFLKTFLKLVKDSRPNKFLFFLLILSFILIPASITSLGILIKNFIDNAFVLKNGENFYNSEKLFFYLSKYIIYFICLAFVLAFASCLRVFAINYINDFLVFKIKEKIFNKMLNLNIKDFDRFGKNFFKTLLGFDIEEVITSINLKLSLIARNIGLFGGSIFLLFFSNVRLSFIIIISILFVLFFISIMGLRLKKSIKNLKELKNQIFLYLDESISFIKIIKISNQTQKQLENLENSHKKILKNAFFVYIFRGFFVGFIIFCLFLTIILTIYLGSLMILNGSITQGVLSSFIFYALVASTSLGGIIESFFEISKYRLNFEKIQNIIKLDSDSKDFNLQKKNEIFRFQNLEFQRVFFRYENNANLILKNLNFKISKGEKVSIIGPSGSGKSTILNLIFGFFEPTSGEIFLNDINLKNIDLNSYYKKLSILSQEVEIFSISLYENLIYGADHPDEKLLLNLIERFNLKDFIESLNQKIHNKLGDESGIKLSGGQKQRVGLIRALLRKPEILILDESTASLDAQNEADIYNFLLSDSCKELTIIFVTHKLSYLNQMNKIIKLLDCGEIDSILENNS
jgi:ABC-type multidrug transport system fused ATPase/permease subunit